MGERVRLKVSGIAGRGLGVAHHNGVPWLISGALPGEHVLAEPKRTSRGVVYASTTKILGSPNEARGVIPCPNAGVCGGCDWWYVDPHKAADLKAMCASQAARFDAPLSRALAKASVTPSPFFASYRIRFRMHFDPQQGKLGFYSYRSHKPAPFEGCTVIRPAAAKAMTNLEKLLRKTCRTPLEVEWLEDELGRNAIVSLVADTADQSDPGLFAIQRHWEPEAPAVGLGMVNKRKRKTWWLGEDSLTLRLPWPLEVPQGSFFQANRWVAPLMWKLVQNEATGGVCWDLYAGCGFLASAASGQVCAVEQFRPSAEAARKNLPEARVVARPAEAFLHRAKRPKEEPFTVILDPPRAGCSREVVRKVAELKPEKIIYCSCEPSTWARDVARFRKLGFTLKSLKLLDMFPGTHHVEVFSVLEPDNRR